VCPVKDKHGFESMAVYVNNTDYYQRNKSAVLNPEKIAITAKCIGIEPKLVFKNLFIQMAYNQHHQLTVARQISELIQLKKQDIKLVVNNLTKFFKESKNNNQAATVLKEVLGILSKVCARNKVALICTGDSNVTSKGIIPRPIGGTYLKHSVNVVVHLRESSHFLFKATLIKHQYVKTPKSAILHSRKTGGG